MLMGRHTAAFGTLAAGFFRRLAEERREKLIEQLATRAAYRTMNKITVRQATSGEALPQLRERGSD